MSLSSFLFFISSIFKKHESIIQIARWQNTSLLNTQSMCQLQWRSVIFWDKIKIHFRCYFGDGRENLVINAEHFFFFFFLLPCEIVKFQTIRSQFHSLMKLSNTFQSIQRNSSNIQCKYLTFFWQLLTVN